MRGSSLSDPKVIDALRPFIVTSWNQHNDESTPKEIQSLLDAESPGRGSNSHCFILDSGGRLVHPFNAFPPLTRGPAQPTNESVAYFAAEVARGAEKLKLSKDAYKNHAVTLPDAARGVRLFVRLPDSRMSNAYRSPVVETVEDKGEMKFLARPESERTIDAAALSRWLKLCYPGGVNEQIGPFDTVEGTLTLKSAGTDTAVLSGKIKMASRERADHPFEGTFEAVLTYKGDAVSLRGVVDGAYPRFDQPRQKWMDWKLVVAVESRPE